MDPVGTRSTASELLIRGIPDAVERVPTQWFMGLMRENLFLRNLSSIEEEREPAAGSSREPRAKQFGQFFP